ncbi:AAA family ATPase [Spirosoma montaniterrae]|uniref:ATPase n=1 Tax=Spirosoma montaniterrae TaxID=1178516 RepID=A0A1P9X3R9_9BACT|nr:AAA family ATPase [Spirosoma montaniterrae]AQG82286.1 ATPase [Spirosoma montaniterrae]
MEKQHLTYFKIENFKRFDSFEMSNLGQFNLIVGDNNVGKTSVLEGLCFDENVARLSFNYFTNFMSRKIYGLKAGEPDEMGKINYWEFTLKESSKPLQITVENDKPFSIKIELKTTLELSEYDRERIRKNSIGETPNIWIKSTVSRDNQDQIDYVGALANALFNRQDLGKNFLDWYMPFLPVNTSFSEDMVSFFYYYFNRNKAARQELEENLKQLIPNLEEIRPDRLFDNQETLSIGLTNRNFYSPLGQFGDGTVKLTMLLMEIFVAQNRRLMVDEIGSGIHFTRLKNYWKTVLQLCAKYNVQLFATTHSLECQQAFVEALEDPDMQPYQKDARNISLIENKAGEVKAVTYDFGQFEYALNIGFNTRGGAR